MARTKSINNGVKYTVVLPESNIIELKELAGQKRINSVNAGVREAVEEYIVKMKMETYKNRLMDAVKDTEFLKRNNDVMKSFTYADKETEEMMPEW
jgi:hypothetical protein